MLSITPVCVYVRTSWDSPFIVAGLGVITNLLRTLLFSYWIATDLCHCICHKSRSRGVADVGFTRILHHVTVSIQQIFLHKKQYYTSRQAWLYTACHSIQASHLFIRTSTTLLATRLACILCFLHIYTLHICTTSVSCMQDNADSPPCQQPHHINSLCHMQAASSP